METVLESNRVHSRLLDTESSSRLLNNETLAPLINEYESFIKALQSQVDFYKKDHEKLRVELTDVVDENNNLSAQLKAALSKHEHILSPSYRKEIDMVANLQQQLALATQEKESAVEMWRCSLKEVASLEEELKTYQDNRHVDLAQKQLEKVKEQYSEAITLLDGKLTWLKNELNKERSLRTELQEELSKLQLEYQSSTARLHECDKELCVTLRDKLELEKRAHVLENKITCLLEDKEALSNSSNKLEEALTRCHEQLEELSRRYGEACGKVEEALGLVDCACAERDRALLGEAAAKEESAQSKVALSRLIEDAGEKVKEEAERLKEKYNRKIETVLYDMKKLDESLKEKTAELSREMKDHQSTQDQLERICKMKSQLDQPGAPGLERRMQDLFREVNELHNLNFQLKQDKNNLLTEINRLKDRQQLELNEKDSQCTFLEHHLAGLKLDLKAALEARDEALAHMERLSGEVTSLRRELDLTRRKSSTDLHAALQHAEDLECEKHLEERDELIARLQEVQMKGVDVANELHHHLESQQQMKNKWQKAMKTLTLRFEKRIQELRRESSSLKEENQRLQSELKTNRKYAVYKHLDDT